MVQADVTRLTAELSKARQLVTSLQEKEESLQQVMILASDWLILTSDWFSASMASLLYRLGPHYLGSLQAPQVTNTGEVLTSQIAEEKMIIGLNSVAMTEMTLSKIRKVYSKVDNKSIAKQLGMTTHENATPIR